MNKLLPKLIAMVTVASICFPSVNVNALDGYPPVNIECTGGVFSDVNFMDKECNYIEYLKHQGIINGYSDGTFKSNNLITRGELAKFLVNGLNITINTDTTKFPDVDISNKFYGEIHTLKKLEIINGFSDGEFKSEQNVTRGELAKFMVKAGEYKKGTNAFYYEPDPAKLMDVFADIPSDNKFKTEINKVIATGVIVYYRVVPGGMKLTFRPNDFVTRGELAHFSTNLIKHTNLHKVECSDYYCQDKFTGQRSRPINQITDQFKTYNSDLLSLSLRKPDNLSPLESDYGQARVMTMLFFDTEVYLDDMYSYSITIYEPLTETPPPGPDPYEQYENKGILKYLTINGRSYPVYLYALDSNPYIKQYVYRINIDDKYYIDANISYSFRTGIDEYFLNALNAFPTDKELITIEEVIKSIEF